MARILICDDSLFMRHSLKKILETGGHQIVGEAGDGAQGVKKYKELQPDLATMDITMPEMDGVQALKEIKKFFPGAKVIMVSAMGQESMVRDAILTGAKDFIVKPFKEGRVLYSVEKVLSNSELGNMLF
ncbi:MAG: response regulator [Peptococcaceae bacterium]